MAVVQVCTDEQLWVFRPEGNPLCEVSKEQAALLTEKGMIHVPLQPPAETPWVQLIKLNNGEWMQSEWARGYALIAPSIKGLVHKRHDDQWMWSFTGELVGPISSADVYKLYYWGDMEITFPFIGEDGVPDQAWIRLHTAREGLVWYLNTYYHGANVCHELDGFIHAKPQED